MKVGDAVRVMTKEGPKYGVIVSTVKRKFMVGEVVDILLEGEVKPYLRENVSLIDEN